MEDAPFKKKLSYVIQGPLYTPHAFCALLRISCDIANPPATVEVNHATDDQRKELLRCMNGTDVMQPEMRLIFGASQQREVRNRDVRNHREEVRLIPNELSAL